AADEDYEIGGVSVELRSPERRPLAAAELPFAKPACSMELAEFDFVPAGDGCTAEGLPDVSGKIAVFDAGGCSDYEKALSAQLGGAAGFLVPRTSGAKQTTGDTPITIRGATVALEDVVRIRNSRETVRGQMGPAPDDTWGYVRILEMTDLAAPRQIGRFATENTRRCPAKDNGWYSVHNPVVVDNIAYFSWYSDGVRAVDISDPAKPVEIGSFVISQHEHGKQASRGRRFHVGENDEPATFVWGVFVENGLIYLSDEMTGLWIVGLKPPSSEETRVAQN
ncbi:MAG TPA: PA domain-containing protein, partial [Bryobacteraceae bacterium]|nr:PA domain-containing protein [Bryobacteraceae bacterium]